MTTSKAALAKHDLATVLDQFETAVRDISTGTRFIWAESITVTMGKRKGRKVFIVHDDTEEGEGMGTTLTEAITNYLAGYEKWKENHLVKPPKTRKKDAPKDVGKKGKKAASSTATNQKHSAKVRKLSS